MKDKKIKKMVFTAMFAAVICVATMAVQIKSPMDGYVNLGDAFVILSGWILGPLYGGCAAGIGSALADIFSGYVYYAPATFIIKALVAIIAFIGFQTKINKKIAEILSATAGELMMILGYFIYAALLMGKGTTATASIPGNIVQGIVGIVVSVVIYEILQKNESIKEIFK